MKFAEWMWRVLPQRRLLSLLGCFLFVTILMGCETLKELVPFPPKEEPKVTYIEGYREVVTITKGEPSPITGFGVPPAVMADLGDCLSKSVGTLEPPAFDDPPLQQIEPIPDPMFQAPTPRLHDSGLIKQTRWQLPGPVPWVKSSPTGLDFE